MLDIEITLALFNFAALYLAKKEKYRARAFERAAWNLDGFGNFIEAYDKKEKLEAIPGVGKSVIAVIKKIQEYGNSRDVDQKYLADIFWAQLSKINNCGPRILQKIFESNITSFDELRCAIRSSEIQLTKSAEFSILEYINLVNPLGDEYIGIPMPIGLMISKELIKDLRHLKLKSCGETRMCSDRVKSIEFITSKLNMDFIYQEVKKHRYFQQLVKITEKSIQVLIFPGIKCLINLVSKKDEIFFLFCKSSPQSHIKEISTLLNRKGLNIKNKGIFKEGKNINTDLKDEKDIYKLLDLKYIPPEIRHLPISRNHNDLDDLISLDSIKGDFHVHTTFSDGLDTLEEMANQGISLGYEYLGIAEHSESMKVGNGLTVGELMAQISLIDKFNSNNPDINILKSSEVDILSNGALDFPSNVLNNLDFVIAAIHSRTKMGYNEMTSRILCAVENPYVNILAHPTGSMSSRPGNYFAKRNPWNLDFNRIAKACAHNHVAMEINSFPERLDLNSENIRIALEYGVKFVINTDSHSANHLFLLKYGIMIARRAGCKRSDILNTLPLDQVMNYFGQKPNRLKEEINLHIRSDNSNFSRALEASTMNSIFSELMKKKKIPQVVGIDLTSAKEKESGWALLKGVESQTKRLKTDEDLLNATSTVSPDIVSIDSPLSLPFGRCCTKPECKCRISGITRLCERFLMANGIGVFPALIPSMVGLTTRGIELKKKFERIGLKVIESYPGAAQDLLGIPRKKRGMTSLYNGLLQFGIIPDKSLPELSHDELDAITSALVGYFYLSDQYFGLGDERENLLIVPSIPSFKVNQSTQSVIALAGENGSGKSTVAMYLALNYGFKYLSYSKLIAKIAKLGKDYDKSALQKAGLELHNKIGQKEITTRLIREAPKDKHIVVDGMRFIEDLKTLKNMFGNRLFPIVVESNHSLILKRLEKDPFYNINSLNNLKKIIYHEVDSKIFEVTFQISERIANNKSFRLLFERVDQIVRNLEEKEKYQCHQ